MKWNEGNVKFENEEKLSNYTGSSFSMNLHFKIINSTAIHI